MQHRADVERARGAASADPAAFESVFADLIDRIYAFTLRRTPSVEVAQRLSERALARVFRDLHRYEGNVSLAAWVLARVKRELRREASASRARTPSHAAAPPAGSLG